LNDTIPKTIGTKDLREAQSQCDQIFSQEFIAQLPFLNALARALCRDRELAADLAQQAALRAWQARRRYQIGTNMKAWLRVILRNEHSSVRRRAWRTVQLEPDLESSLETCHQQELSSELADAVRAIYSLPPTQRRDFISVAIGGITYREAAIISHCSTGTTKSRVARARYAIRKMCDGTSPSSRSLRPPIGEATNILLSDLNEASASCLTSIADPDDDMTPSPTSSITYENASWH
jgi:RNA polymerase sigma-70 factor (ECF subfamily)